MICKGEWLPCDDGIVRPIMWASVLRGDGEWRRTEFLLDTGADRTVMSANLFAVIVDRPAERVLLLHGADGYTVQRR